MSLWIGYCSSAASAGQPFDEAAADQLIRQSLHAWQVPGAAVVAVSRDRVLYVKGHGVRELGKPDPVEIDTVFPLASCSKAFTALLISQLVDDGRMAWDDPVRRHLPDFRLSDPVADAGVSIRDLLCHRTGLAQHDFLWYHSPLPQAEIVRRAGLLPLNRTFRATFQYQSMMVTAAGLAANRAGGKPWDVLMRERIFTPLQMTNTTCVTPKDNRATPHRPDAGGTLAPIPWYEQNEPNAACSIHTTARDLGHWLIFQLGDGAFQGRRIVSPAGLAETHSPHTPQRIEGIDAHLNPETTLMSYGLGWVLHDYRGHLLWSHTGLIDGFRAQVAIAPKSGCAVAVLSNRFETRMNLAIVNNFLDRMLDLPPRDWDAYLRQVVAAQTEALAAERAARDQLRDPAGKPSRPVADLVGRYEHPAYGAVEIKIEDDQLIWRWNKFRIAMRYFRGLEFDLRDRDLREQTMAFVERNGQITGFRLFDVEFVKR